MTRRPLGFLVAIAVGALLASLLTFWLAVRPPRLHASLEPADVGLDVRDVTVTAADGVTLHGWLVPRPGAPGIVVLHGYPADKADMLPIAAALAPRFTVLLMDLRYFGRSGGRATTLGVRERGDLRSAVDFLAAQRVSPLGVFGFSLGGAIAIMAAADDPRIRAVAAYAPFSDLKALARELYGWLWLARYPFVELMALWGRIFLGVDLGSASPVAAATRLTATPVLIVASRADEQIPFHHAEALRAALRANPAAEFAVLGQGRHAELPADFTARLVRFFSAHLAPPPAPHLAPTPGAR